MKTVVIFPTATLLNEDGKVYKGIYELINRLSDDGNEVIFLSHNKKNLVELLDEFEFVHFIKRNQIREFIKETEETLFVLVGSSDVDLYLAANKKILLINPLWSYIQEEKAVRYGFGIKSPKGVARVLKIIKNYSAWFYTLKIDDKTTVHALTRANYYGQVESKSEVELLKAFEDLLKEGNRKYFKVLLYYFIGAIVNNEIFKEVDIWAIMPSSKTTLNKEMEDLKERIRLLMGKKLKQPLFIRHTQSSKSRGMAHSNRLYCDRHFDTIIINPYYKGKLQGKNICVLDDYSTNGTHFETVRNLLRHEGVNQIFLVSLGKFQRGDGFEYLQQEYIINGNVFENNYSYSSLSKEEIKGEFNNDARLDLRNLYKLLRENKIR